MKLIPLKCDSCGGPLRRVRRDTVLCRHCSTAYLVHVQPRESIRIPQSEPPRDAVEHEREHVPTPREIEIRKQIVESEYRFWQSVPDSPAVHRRRGYKLAVDTEPHMTVSGTVIATGLLLGVIAIVAETPPLGYVAATVAGGGIVFSVKRLLDVVRANRLIDEFVTEQTKLRKEIRNIRGELELQERLP